MARTMMKRLIERDKKICHYCKCRVVLSNGDGSVYIGHMATKDHIVPKSMGGRAIIENFVIACRRCNEYRGDHLYYCACDFCTKAIADFMKRVFGGTMGPVKTKVWKHHDGTWVTSYGLTSRASNTWEDAMRYVPTHERANA